MNNTEGGVGCLAKWVGHSNTPTLQMLLMACVWHTSMWGTKQKVISFVAQAKKTSMHSEFLQREAEQSQPDSVKSHVGTQGQATHQEPNRRSVQYGVVVVPKALPWWMFALCST